MKGGRFSGKLRGTQSAMRNLNRQVRRIKGRTVEGLEIGANIIVLESKKRSPVEFGDMKASHYVRRAGGGHRPVVRMGLTSEYAIYVHENMEARHPVGEAKFLERAINHSLPKVLRAVHKFARIR